MAKKETEETKDNLPFDPDALDAGSYYKRLEGYLKKFRYARPVPGFTAWFGRKFPKPTPLMFVHPNRKVLYDVGACFYCAWGERPARLITSHELIDIWLGKLDEEVTGTFYNLPQYLLVIYHFREQVDNRKKEDVVRHVVLNRALERKPTLVLCETDLPEVRKVFKKRNWPVHDRDDLLEFYPAGTGYYDDDEDDGPRGEC